MTEPDDVPTTGELATWLVVASITARGTFRWEPAGDGGFRFAFGGEPPALVDVPPSTDVAFWHESPDRWRLEVGGRLLAVSDGRQAVAWCDDGVRVGRSLLMPVGPAALLRPVDVPSSDAHGDVERDDLLGRTAWRWTSGSTTQWVDEQTGCLLRLEQPDGVLALTALDVVPGLEPDLFDVPEVDPAQVVEWLQRPSREPRTAEPASAPPAGFTVTTWPAGTLSWPVEGDPSVPEVLLELGSLGPRVLLGVAPVGREPRTADGAQVRRWDGDGWSFALSWYDGLTPDDVDRVVASVPAQW